MATTEVTRPNLSALESANRLRDLQHLLFGGPQEAKEEGGEETGLLKKSTAKLTSDTDATASAAADAADDATKPVDPLDGLRLIMGVDGRFGTAATRLANHLLFGPGIRRADEGCGSEAFEELIVLVCRDRVHVHCHPNAFWTLAPLLVHWPALDLYCLTPSQISTEPELAEDFKVMAFLAMTAQCETIGVPLEGKGYMEMEKWPLVQASANEDYGGHGFFTLNHQVVDVTKMLESLYTIADVPALRAAAHGDLAALTMHWSSTRDALDRALSSGRSSSGKNGSSSVTNSSSSSSSSSSSYKGAYLCAGNVEKLLLASDNVASALLSYYKYSANQCHAAKADIATAAAATIETEQENVYSMSAPVADAYAIDAGAIVLESGQASGRMWCGRTWFLPDGSSKGGEQGPTGKGVPANQGDNARSRALAAYEVAIEAVNACISVYTETLDPAKAITTASAAAALRASASGYDKPEIQLFATPEDSNDTPPLALPTKRAMRCLKVCRCILLPLSGAVNRPGGHEEGERGGGGRVGGGGGRGDRGGGAGVVFAETFADGGVMVPGWRQATRLTGHIPLHYEYRHGGKVKGATTGLRVSLKAPAPSWRLARLQDACTGLPAVTEDMLEELPDDGIESSSSSSSSYSSSSYSRNSRGHASSSTTSDDGGAVGSEQPVPIHVLVGSPGSGKEVVLASLRTIVPTDNITWTVVEQPLDGARTSLEQLARDTAAAVVAITEAIANGSSGSTSTGAHHHGATTAGAAARQQQPSTPRYRLLVLASGLFGVDTVAATLANVGGARLANICACVDDRAVFTEGLRPHPHLLKQLLPGFVSCVVFTGRPGAPEEAAAQRLVRAALPNANILRAAQGHFARGEDVEALLDTNAFYTPRLTLCRVLLRPQWRMAAIQAKDALAGCGRGEEGEEEEEERGDNGVEELMRIDFYQPLNLKAVLKLLARWRTEEAQSICGEVLFVKGICRATTITTGTTSDTKGGKGREQDGDGWHAIYTAGMSAFANALPQPPPSQPGGGAITAGYIVVYGADLQEMTLRDDLRACQARGPEPRALLTRVPSTIRADLASQLKSEPVPEGWFFSGHAWMTLEGDRQSEHPKLGEACQQWLVSENAKIEATNAEIMDVPDLYAVPVREKEDEEEKEEEKRGEVVEKEKEEEEQLAGRPAVTAANARRTRRSLPPIPSKSM